MTFEENPQAPVCEENLTDFFKDLHRHPETALEEKRTTERLRRVLTAHGVRLGDTGMETGLLAVIGGKKPGRTVALRGDMDALPVQEESGLPYASEIPGKMHACGHDFHTSAVLGAALLLKEREDELPGTVKVIFQPGEETSDGATRMIATGLLDDVEEFYALHTYPGFEAGTLGIKTGAVMAAPDYFRATVTGRGAHAGNPHLGVDPVPAMAAIVLGAQSIVSRRVSAFDNAVISITHVEAGTTWNVVPESVFMEGTVRSLDNGVRSFLRESLENLIVSTAAAYGCTGAFEWIPGPDPLINDASLCEAASKVAAEMGFNVARQDDTMGGEDFSEYLKKAPGLFVRVGTGGGYPNHHPRFTADPAALWPAARFFARLAESRLNA